MFYDLGPGIFLPETDPRFYAIPRDDAAVLRSDPNRSDSIVRLSNSLEQRSLSSLLSPSLFSLACSLLMIKICNYVFYTVSK